LRAGTICHKRAVNREGTSIKTSDSCVLECFLLTSVTQNYLDQDITTTHNQHKNILLWLWDKSR